MGVATHRRALPGGDEARRLRRDHHRGRGRRAHLPLDQERRGQVPLRQGAVGSHSTDTQLVIKDELHDQNVRVCCIGPAGEKLSRMACIVNERRVVGRKGLGAVMGSKNLKAIALRGDGQMAIADHEKFDVARKRMLDAMRKSPILYSSSPATAPPPPGISPRRSASIPAKNWTATGVFTPADKIGGVAIEAPAWARRRCAGCPVACSQLRLAQEGPYAGFVHRGPGVRDALLVRRRHRRRQSGRHHRRRPRSPTSWASTPCRPA